MHTPHCVKSVHIWSFFWSVFSHIRTEYGEIQSIASWEIEAVMCLQQEILWQYFFTYWLFWKERANAWVWSRKEKLCLEPLLLNLFERASINRGRRLKISRKHLYQIKDFQKSKFFINSSGFYSIIYVRYLIFI